MAIKIKTHRICKNPECQREFRKYSSFDKYCSGDCKTAVEGFKVKKPQKPIAKLSGKKKKETAEYLKLRIQFLERPENKICPVTGLATTEIHHKKGRLGDLYLNTNYWLAVSRKGHQKIEENPTWAKENGYSISRLEKNKMEAYLIIHGGKK